MSASGIEAIGGERYGLWTLLEGVRREGQVIYRHAKCDCGAEKWVNYQNVKQGKSKSCGCLRVAVSATINLSHGKTGSKTYKIWAGMKRRCNNPNEKFYSHYGGRGIRVDPAWEKSFPQFLADMGECPDGHSIERLDVDRGYSKDNCKWIPESQQSRNTRKSKLTMADAMQIRSLVAAGGHAPSVARQYGVDRTMVNKIVRGECWA